MKLISRVFATVLSFFAATSLFTNAALAGPLVSSRSFEQLLASCSAPSLDISVVASYRDMIATTRLSQVSRVKQNVLSAAVLRIDTPQTKIEYASVAATVPVFDLTVDMTKMENGAYPATLTTELIGRTVNVKDVTCEFAQAPLQ